MTTCYHVIYWTLTDRNFTLCSYVVFRTVTTDAIETYPFVQTGCSTGSSCGDASCDSEFKFYFWRWYFCVLIKKRKSILSFCNFLTELKRTFVIILSFCFFAGLHASYLCLGRSLPRCNLGDIYTCQSSHKLPRFYSHTLCSNSCNSTL